MHALGLRIAQGLVPHEAYYWDLDDKTRAFANASPRRTRECRPSRRRLYSAVLAYLNAVKAAGSDDSDRVMDMRKSKVNDVFGHTLDPRRRPQEHSMYISEVKTPSESKGDWDYYKIIKTIRGEEAFGKLAELDLPAGQEVK